MKAKLNLQNREPIFIKINPQKMKYCFLKIDMDFAFIFKVLEKDLRSNFIKVNTLMAN